MSIDSDPICKKITLEPRFNEIFYMTLEMLTLVGLSCVFHLFFKRLGQPTIVAQMAAGLFIGRTFMSRVVDIQLYNLNDNDHLINMATMGSSLFMFLIGLEMDFDFLRRTFRAGFVITMACTSISAVIAVVAGPVLYATVGVQCGRSLFAIILIITLSNSSSPMLIRMLTELKLTMSGVGRIGISASVINDATFLTVISLMVLFLKRADQVRGHEKSGNVGNFLDGIIGLVLVGASVGVLRVVVRLINRMNMKRQVIPDEVLWTLIMLVFFLTALMESFGFQSMIAGFILGMAFPRVGPAARTVTKKLSSPVNAFVLPLYFGYAGVETDLFMLREKKVLFLVAALVILGTAGKVASTVIATRFFGLQVKEGLVLGFLLNVKGHVELILVSLGTKFGIWSEEINQALLISMLFSSMTAGPAAAYIVRRERLAIKYHSSGLEWLDLDTELRVMTCVHTQHDLPTLLDLIQISSGTNRSQFTPYLMHLIEYNENVATHKLYNQIQEDDDDIQSQNVRQVNATANAFIIETGIKLCQLTGVSRFTNMHENICNGAQDIRAALIIVPYHRKQRFDGKMGAAKEGIREFNGNVLRSAPCTVGILVDRGLGGGGGGAIGGMASSVQTGSAMSGKQAVLYEVVVLFFGGPDDREAVAYGSRIAMHPCASVTVVRFMSMYGRNGIVSRMGSASSHRSGEVIINAEEDPVVDPDKEFLADFHNMFVATGMITYQEQAVENSSDTVAALAAMERMYSLFIVGRQRQGPSAHLTEGMSVWQECKELGEIGDLLASSDFMSHGSVLVVQQHDASKTMYI